MKKVAIITPILLFLSCCICSAEMVMFKIGPFTLKPIHGAPVKVKGIEVYDNLFFYITTTGEEGFIEPSNLSNISALKAHLEREKTHRKQETSPKQKYTSQPKTTAPVAPTSYSGFAKNVVRILNTSYGNVCHAELNGFFSKTLKIDWTSRTVMLHTAKVLAEIGSVKEQLYKDGVRYLQIPNNIGTYNVFDWKTGNKETISERAVLNTWTTKRGAASLSRSLITWVSYRRFPFR